LETSDVGGGVMNDDALATKGGNDRGCTDARVVMEFPGEMEGGDYALFYFHLSLGQLRHKNILFIKCSLTPSPSCSAGITITMTTAAAVECQIIIIANRWHSSPSSMPNMLPPTFTPKTHILC